MTKKLLFSDRTWTALMLWKVEKIGKIDLLLRRRQDLVPHTAVLHTAFFQEDPCWQIEMAGSQRWIWGKKYKLYYINSPTRSTWRHHLSSSVFYYRKTWSTCIDLYLARFRLGAKVEDVSTQKTSTAWTPSPMKRSNVRLVTLASSSAAWGTRKTSTSAWLVDPIIIVGYQVI